MVQYVDIAEGKFSQEMYDTPVRSLPVCYTDTRGGVDPPDFR